MEITGFKNLEVVKKALESQLKEFRECVEMLEQE